MLLADRCCLVAGASSARGVGAAVVRLFVEHGARVFAVDHRMDDGVVEELRHDAGLASTDGRVRGMQCDIRDPAECACAVRSAIDGHGGIDCLVNSTGLVRSQAMLEISPAALHELVSVNLVGTFNLCQAVLGHFTDRRRGSIVNVASVAAQRGGGLVGGAHYAAAKGGVVSLTRTIAREFGPVGVRANVVSPSMLRTAMIDGVADEVIDGVVGQVPLGRLGTPDDVAGACLFLASDLSGYVTGATLDVNGGMHIH